MKFKISETRFMAFAVLAWCLILFVLWLALRGLENPWSTGIFVGRLHILAVHLPIGLLIGALAVELLRKIPFLQPYARGAVAMLWLSLFGGIGATILGFTLMRSDLYSGSFMVKHLWTGLGVVVLTAVSLFLRVRNVHRPAYLTALGATVGLTAISSHYGGNMVHGETYLTEHAPPMIAPFLGHGEPAESAGELALEERGIYEHIIQPIFDAKCVECHYEGKVKGNLRMDSFEWLAKGGDYGPSFVPGDVEGSELYFRVTADPDEDDFMPPPGKTEPMTPEEITLLAWWIETGASPTLKVKEAKPDTEIQIILEGMLHKGERQVKTAQSRVHPSFAHPG